MNHKNTLYLLLITLCTPSISAADWMFRENNCKEQKTHAGQEQCFSAELKRFRAIKAIRKCMAYNRKGPKDSEGVPYACREKFDEFVTVATEQEIEETKTIINI